MADTTTPVRKKKLPPLNGEASTEETEKPKKKVVRKKKKPTGETTEDTAQEKPRTTPRRKKAASADSTTEAGAESSAPRKKKRAVKKTEDADADPSSARSGASQPEDVSGSKASLIKSPKEGTPRKKKVKKKVKKTTDTAEDSNYFDSTLAADLSEIQDDVIAHDAKVDEEEEEESYSKQQYSTASAALRSQPTEKFYIETDGGFKGEYKSRFAKRQAEELKEKAVVHEEPKNTTIEFAINTHKVIRTFCLFCHGLLAGLAAWHIVIAYMLLDFGDFDFIVHYRKLALPVQCIFYILLVLCSLSALDRSDVANPGRGFLLKALTLQNGAASVVLYFAALVISLTNGALEDKIHLYEIKPELWNNTATASDDLKLWRDLNTSRNVLSIVGWFIISLSPLTDRLTENLQETDEEDLLGVEVETGKSAIA